METGAATRASSPRVALAARSIQQRAATKIRNESVMVLRRFEAKETSVTRMRRGSTPPLHDV
jgi:hypothetical protein